MTWNSRIIQFRKSFVIKIATRRQSLESARRQLERKGFFFNDEEKNQIIHAKIKGFVVAGFFIFFFNTAFQSTTHIIITNAPPYPFMNRVFGGNGNIFKSIFLVLKAFQKLKFLITIQKTSEALNT